MDLTPERIIKTLLVEDHPVVTEGVRALLASERDIHLVGSTGCGGEVAALVDRLGPEVVVMDVGLPDIDGISAIRELQHCHPEVLVIVLTAQPDASRLHEALEAGARGFLSKSAHHTLLAAAIRCVIRGGVALEAALVPQFLHRISSTEPPPGLYLSNREREVLRWISKGYANKQISGEMHLAESTVKKYVYTLMGKLGASDRAHAASLGIKLGLIE